MRLINADALMETAEKTLYADHPFIRFMRSQVDNAPTVDVESPWILCEDRLPELDEICLVTEKDGSIRHCYFDSVDPVLFATVEEGMYVKNVVAWIPLPEPYKG